MSAFLHKAYGTNAELSDVEQFRLSRNLFQRFRHGDIAYFQYERGAIEESRLRSVLGVLMLGHPRVQEFWSKDRGNFVASYGSYVDQLIREENAKRSPD